MASDEIYLAHRDAIDRALAAVCRRQRLFGADAEDFGGAVRLHLLAGDCAVLRRFERRSSLRTYLLVVITRAYQDWRNARWGKWRPSAEARRLGPLAVRLETLLVRDGLTLDQAHETLRTGDPAASRAALEVLAGRFPVRPRRTFVSDQAIAEFPAPDADPGVGLAGAEATSAARRAAAVLREFLAARPAQDRLILRMRFEDGFTVADVARALHLDQKGLYRRLERLFGAMRDALGASGIGEPEARNLLAHRGFDEAGLAEPGAAGEGSGRVRLFSRGGGSPGQNARVE